MQIVEINGEYYPLCFPHSIKGETLEYHKRGEGYKKTKKYRILEDTIPDLWSPLTWLDVVQIFDNYGINCAVVHAECKTAGIIAERCVRARHALYMKAKHLIKPIDADFFEMLPVDTRSAAFGIFQLDIIAYEENLMKVDPEYDGMKCTYKGKPCSFARFILVKYGARRKLIIDAMLGRSARL